MGRIVLTITMRTWINRRTAQACAVGPGARFLGTGSVMRPAGLGIRADTRTVRQISNRWSATTTWMGSAQRPPCPALATDEQVQKQMAVERRHTIRDVCRTKQCPYNTKRKCSRGRGCPFLHRATAAVAVGVRADATCRRFGYGRNQSTLLWPNTSRGTWCLHPRRALPMPAAARPPLRSSPLSGEAARSGRHVLWAPDVGTPT